MAQITPTTSSRIADRVQQHYAAHPHLIENLLYRIGATDVQNLGRGFRCACPLHQGDNQRAFSVWFDREVPIWRCMTRCNGAGNLVTLLMRKYQANYPDAVVSLGRFAGLAIDGQQIEIPQETLEQENVDAFLRRMGLWHAEQDQINVFPEDMVQYAMGQLRSDRGRAALTYLQQERHYSIETLGQWRIGFVPANTWVFTDPHTGKPSGWFDDRIAIPWYSMDGVLMGFAGRSLQKTHLIKYKTYPGTKRALMLYGLHDDRSRCMIEQTRTLHLVEGYTDVWRAHQHGAYNTGAVGGTELSPKQIELIASFDLERVVLYLDPDTAGVLASQRIGEQLLGITRVFIAVSPHSCDPGDLLTAESFWTPIHQSLAYAPKLACGPEGTTL